MHRGRRGAYVSKNEKRRLESREETCGWRGKKVIHDSIQSAGPAPSGARAPAGPACAARTATDGYTQPGPAIEP
eukprot:7325050-Prymnesium_polylepis.1